MVLATHEILELDRQATLIRLATLNEEFNKLVAASEGSNADDEHDPEGATIAYERSQLDALVQQARAHLISVDAALHRLAEGNYGTCEVCEQPIPYERLQVRPTALRCVLCSSS